MSTIYNTTDGPLIIDQAGRVLGGRESLPDVDVTSSPVAGHIKAERLIVVDASPADDVDEQLVAVEPTPTPRSKRGATTTQEG